MSTSKFVIVDGNAIVHRAYHALPPMTTQSGQIVNAVYGFTSMLLKTIKDLRPTHIAVTFDMAGGSTARLKKFKEYKATRVKADQALYDQIPLAHDVVSVFGIPIFEKQGYEADDVIGTIVKKIEKNDGVEVFIVTGDMDTLQLVDHHTKVYTLRKGLSDVVIYDAEAVKKRFGFGPEKMVDYKALRGDTSDNIPGVPGIGEKGAGELIKTFGSIVQLYEYIAKHADASDKKMKAGILKKLVAGKKSAFLSYDLSKIDCSVPDLNFNLKDCLLKPFDRAKIVPLFQKFEFVSLLRRLSFNENGNGAEGKEQAKKEKSKKEEFIFKEIKTNEEIPLLRQLVEKSKKWALRAILQGEFFSGSISGLVCTVGAQGFFIPRSFFGELRSLFQDSRLELVGHDIKQLIKALQYHEQVDVKNRLFDVMIASYLLNPGSRATDAPSIILKVLGKELSAGNGQGSLFGVDNRLVAYELSLLTAAAEKLKKELIKTDDLGLLEKMEMPLEFVLADMELNGVAVDTKKLNQLHDRVAERIKSVSKKIYTFAGKEFNISSPIQLRDILFETLQIPAEGIKKGKTGLSTSAEQLEKMRGLHPIVEEIESYRELSKLENTYISVLPTLMNKTTGRIHTSFNQAVTATGRLSSSEPNLQNIPIRTALGREIRDAFIAEPGHLLISADYSQIELRIVASLAEDQKMMDIFARGEDIHAATAAAIHGVPLEKVTKEMRRSAKEINFGVLYGMGVYGLSWRAAISRAEARTFIDTYFREFSGVKKYIDRTLAFTKKEGYCETLFGRRRYIPELNSSNFQLRSAAERMAINHPVQGTAADLMKMAMIKVFEEIKKANASDIKMILQVHDELVLEAPEARANEWAGRVKKYMEEIATLRVPIEVHVGVGRHWGEIK